MTFGQFSQPRLYVCVILAPFTKELLDGNLDEGSFLEIIIKVFEKKQLHLVPLAIKLLENRNSEKIKKFLKDQANCIAAPLIRSYARLSLYKKDHNFLSRKEFYTLIDSLKHIKIVEFDHNDVVRHPLVSKIIRAYQKKSTDAKN